MATMNEMRKEQITLDDARRAGFIVDWPEHPRGQGTPIGDAVRWDVVKSSLSFSGVYVDNGDLCLLLLADACGFVTAKKV